MKHVLASLSLLLSACCGAALAQPAAPSAPAAVPAIADDHQPALPAQLQSQLLDFKALFDKKQFGAARTALEALLVQYPDHVGTLLGLAEVSRELKDQSAYEAYLGRFIVGMAPSKTFRPGGYLLELGRLACERGDFTAALAWVDKVDPREADLHFQAQLFRANLMALQGNRAGAHAVLAQLAPALPRERAAVIMQQARLLHDDGKLSEAFGVLAQGALQLPDDGPLHMDYATLAHMTGRADVAESILRGIMRREPDIADAYNSLGYWLADGNVRLDEALQLITRAQQLSPDSAAIADSLGWVHYRLGHLAQAETHLRRAHGQIRSAEVAAHLGEVLFRKGDKAGAESILREARAAHPANTVLRATIARLQLSL